MTQESDSHSGRGCRVLLVPDSVFWVTGTICQEIARNNPWMVPTVCSTRVLRRLLARDDRLLSKIDVVHFLDPWAPGLLIGKLRDRLPCIGSIHHFSPGVLAGNLETDLVTVGSRQWLEFLVSNGHLHENRVALTPYGVNTRRFVPVTPSGREASRACLGIDPEAFVVGFFSKKSSDAGDRKGIRVLIEGLYRLKARIRHTAVLIVGPGWTDLLQELREAGIDCYYPSFLPDHDDLVQMYHALDVYWVTSRVEGGPLTLLEAMSCGICCITTPVGLAPEIVVEGSNAFLVAIGDVEELGRRTAVIAGSPSLRNRIGSAASADVQRTRDWRQTTASIKAEYRKAVELFAERTRKPLEIDWAESPTDRGLDTSEFPLNAVRRADRSWVRMSEILYWTRSGDFSDSPQIARKLCWQACRVNPWNRESWGSLLRIGYSEVHRRLWPAF